MKSIVISLKSAAVRRRHIEREFGKQNIDFEFFDALTPDLAIPLAQRMQLNVDEEFLTKGELACFMSHVSIWSKMVEENIQYLAVFEDDVYLGEDAVDLLNDESWIDPDWNIIKLEAFADKVFLDKKNTQIKNSKRNVRRLTGKNLGTAGYILSIKGAQKYLEYVKSRLSKPLDELMFDLFIREDKCSVYQICPGLCIQEMKLFRSKESTLTSNLIKDREIRVKRQKKTGLKKMRHEILRIYHQFLKILFAVEHNFR